MSVRILSFNAIHSVIKKMFHKGPVAALAYFIIGYFSTKLGTSAAAIQCGCDLDLRVDSPL
jgi:hypothetical protein